MRQSVALQKDGGKSPKAKNAKKAIIPSNLHEYIFEEDCECDCCPQNKVKLQDWAKKAKRKLKKHSIMDDLAGSSMESDLMPHTQVKVARKGSIMVGHTGENDYDLHTELPGEHFDSFISKEADTLRFNASSRRAKDKKTHKKPFGLVK